MKKHTVYTAFKAIRNAILILVEIYMIYIAFVYTFSDALITSLPIKFVGLVIAWFALSRDFHYEKIIDRLKRIENNQELDFEDVDTSENENSSVDK